MTRRGTFLLITICAVAAVLAGPGVVDAQSVTDRIPQDPSKVTKTDIVQVLVFVIRLLLGFAAAIGAIFIVIAGYQYVMAAGNPEKIEKAKMGLTWSIGGFVLTISAFAIIYLLQTTLKAEHKITEVPGPGGQILKFDGPDNAATIVERLSALVFLFAGAVAVFYLVLGGYRYMTSQGNQELAEKAKKTLIYSGSGLIVVFASWLLIRVLQDGLNVL